jgi:fructose-1,6-bisphosphatase class II
MGLGDWRKSDQAAVETMRKCLDDVPIDGTIVIGEGERDEAPMLFIGEKVGLGAVSPAVAARLPALAIAVDPLEGQHLCATGAPNALVVLAASNRGGLLHAPDLYMQKLVVGPAAKNAVDLDASVSENLRSIARALERDVDDLVVIVLDRPRHAALIEEIRATGARIRLISDGDLSAVTAPLWEAVHAVMGIGRRAEGVLTAAAMRVPERRNLRRLMVTTPEHEARCRVMGFRLAQGTPLRTPPRVTDSFSPRLASPRAR